MSLSTFEVDKSGLRKLLAVRGGKARALTELIQNAWDEDVTQVTVELSRTATRAMATCWCSTRRACVGTAARDGGGKSARAAAGS